MVESEGRFSHGEEINGFITGSIQPGRYELKLDDAGGSIFSSMVLITTDLETKIAFLNQHNKEVYATQINVSGDRWLTVVGVRDESLIDSPIANKIYLLSEDQDASS